MRKNILILTLAAGFMAGMAAAQDKADDLAIIVAKGSTLDNLTSEELNKIFLEEKEQEPGRSQICCYRACGRLRGIQGRTRRHLQI